MKFTNLVCRLALLKVLLQHLQMGDIVLIPLRLSI